MDDAWEGPGRSRSDRAGAGRRLRWTPARGVAAALLALVLCVSTVTLVRHFAVVAEAGAAHASAPGESVSSGGEAPASGASADADLPGGSAQWHSAPLVVHVIGAVNEPGVVELPAPARLRDAVAAAGGLTEDADPDAVNLARLLVDGEQVEVPRKGDTPSDGESASTDAHVDCVDLATADLAELDTLDGVGPALAARIVEHRQANGGRIDLDSLDDVPGIGPALVERVRSGVCP